MADVETEDLTDIKLQEPNLVNKLIDHFKN
jgi:hypothetical protein